MLYFLEYPDSDILMVSTLYIQSHALSPSSPDRIPLGCQYFPTTELDLPCPRWAGFAVFNTLLHPTTPWSHINFSDSPCRPSSICPLEQTLSIHWHPFPLSPFPVYPSFRKPFLPPFIFFASSPDWVWCKWSKKYCLWSCIFFRVLHVQHKPFLLVLTSSWSMTLVLHFGVAKTLNLSAESPLLVRG